MEKMKEIGQSVTGVKRKIGNWAKSVALQGNKNLEKGYGHVSLHADSVFLCGLHKVCNHIMARADLFNCPRGSSACHVDSLATYVRIADLFLLTAALVHN